MLTDEQAVILGQWLGVEKEYDETFGEPEWTGCWIYKNNLLWLTGPSLALIAARWEEGLKNWLLSDSGEVAMMDKLDQPDLNWKYENRTGPSMAYVVMRSKTKFGEAWAKTRVEALHRAILKMLEMK